MRKRESSELDACDESTTVEEVAEEAQKVWLESDVVAPGAAPLSGPASHRGRRKGGGRGPGLVSILARALSAVSHSGPLILGPEAPPSRPLVWLSLQCKAQLVGEEGHRAGT